VEMDYINLNQNQILNQNPNLEKSFSNYSTKSTIDSSPLCELKIKENQEIKIKLDKPNYIILSEILGDIILKNKNKEKHKLEKLRKNFFYFKNLPFLNFKDYLKRIMKYLNPEISTIIISLIYLDFYLNTDKENLFLTDYNVYKIYLISIVLAIKYNEDNLDTNRVFSEVGGISLEKLNFLERKFLKSIDYKLYITNDLFKVYEENLKSFFDLN
jgi:hypothetical protein